MATANNEYAISIFGKAVIKDAEFKKDLRIWIVHVDNDGTTGTFFVNESRVSREDPCNIFTKGKIVLFRGTLKEKFVFVDDICILGDSATVE
ncbi:MAG: hypothetical protein U9Q62_04595 [Campylobacterota bacterium]|nr:hypothetical protein [Campylobacterota bacterium]